MRTIAKNWKTLLVASAFTVVAVAGAASAADKYSATFYVAGMGGHFAKAVAEIDPAAPTPITISALTKVDIGDKTTHPTHDARIDNNDRNVMFWSTYKIDPATKGTHVGKTDLTTGKVILDMPVDVPAEATKTGSMYCASAQAKDHFLPISMSHKGYIDVFKKSDLSRTQRVFLEGTEADIKVPYKFYHGTNSPDMKKLLITINQADADHGNIVGKVHMVMMDMDEFVAGKVKVLKTGVAAGAEKKTVSFRQYFSPDGKLIANATGDRLLLINAETLEVLDNEMVGKLDEAHDAIFTPDSKYVVVTQRAKRVNEGCATPDAPKDGEFVMDGALQLYDVAAGKFNETKTSVCLACHDKEGLDAHAVLCGLDANFAAAK